MNGAAAVPVITDWGTAIMSSLALALAMFMGFIPKLIGALLILLVGWIIARVVYSLVVKGLRLVHFNQVADRAEIDQFLANAGIRLDASEVLGKLAYWFLMLIFIGAAFNVFGLPQVTEIVNRILAFLPNVVVAVVVMLLGALAANFVGNVVRGAAGTSHLGNPDLISGFARAAVLVFAALIALEQLNIAPAILNTLWMALVGMFALAGALAFGLGGRDVAKRMLEDWYGRRHEMARLADTAVDTAAAQARPVTPLSDTERRAA